MSVRVTTKYEISMHTMASPHQLSSLPPPPPPPPTGQTLALVSALSNPIHHERHVAAIRARDETLADPTRYEHWCLQLAYVLVGCDRPVDLLIHRVDPVQWQQWKQTDLPAVLRLEQDASLWIPFGQTAGLMLKNALARPPILPTGQVLTMSLEAASLVKESLLRALQCQHAELRAVASSIIATTAVSIDAVQPALHITAWPSLVPTLIQNIETLWTATNAAVSAASEGSMQTIQKIMEDGPGEIPEADLDHLIATLIRVLDLSSQSINSSSSHTNIISMLDSLVVPALQSLAACLAAHLMPSALVAHWNDYLQALSGLATFSTSANSSATTEATPTVAKWVCRNLVTILDTNTEYLAPHLSQICPFMLSATAAAVNSNNNNNNSNPSADVIEAVALEACDFWLTFASLDDCVTSGEMHDVVGALLPQLIPILLNNLVYSTDKQRELLEANDIAVAAAAVVEGNEHHHHPDHNLRPIFHKCRARTAGAPTTQKKSSGDYDNNDQEDTGYDSDNDAVDDDDDDDFDDDGNEWTLRKCAAASLDALANLYGGEIILPSLLPALEQGLQQTADPWQQEACILALGAVAEGCLEEMNTHMGQIHPYLMHLLSSTDQQQQLLPQVKCMAAWTAGQYAGWAVEQVQSGTQGHVLAELTKILLRNLLDSHPKVQVACCAAFGVVVGAAGDLMAPYLEPVYQALATALSRYHGQSLLTLFDVFGTMGECCGPAIAEGHLPSLYVPPLLRLWDGLAKRDPSDRTLLPLMESMASIALASGMNFQPYALECFDNAMCIIESVTLLLMTTGEYHHSNHNQNEEDVDPIICAADLLDSLVEGLGGNFAALLSSSVRYGPHFLNVLLVLCQHEITGVRMSALALLGDLARNAPSVLEPALAPLIKEAIECIDLLQPSVAINAVWAVGEICVRCVGNAPLLEPFAPALLQNAITLLVGYGVTDGGGGADTDGNPWGGGGDQPRGCVIPGLSENSAACIGRLSMVHPQFVAADLPRFLCRWCDGMAKIRDNTERRDAFQGFIQAVYANPQAIQQAAANASDAIGSILFAIISWHMPPELPEESTSLLSGDYGFLPFPPAEAELGAALVKLVQDMRLSVGEDVWHTVSKRLPVNVRKLLRDNYYQH